MERTNAGTSHLRSISERGQHSLIMDEDVWGDEDGLPQADIRREWETRNERFVNEGIRQGLDVGKEQTAEAGFDQGYSEGIAIGQRLGHLQGQIQTLAIFCGQVSGTSAQQAEIQALQSACAEEEKRFVVSQCLQAASTIPDSCALLGIAARLEDTELGLSRWQGLATAANVDPKCSAEATLAIERIAQRTQACLSLPER